MIRRLYLSTLSFVADPARVRMTIGIMMLALAAAALLVPGAVVLAGEAGGGPH
jgi:hypothetical protein